MFEFEKILIIFTSFFFVELPKEKPTIVTDKDKYEPGDTLNANCTSAASKPASSLTFFLNNMPVSLYIYYKNMILNTGAKKIVQNHYKQLMLA